MKSMRLLLLAVILMDAGCGQKGPLVLPDAQHPRKKMKLPAVPKPTSTPASPSTSAPADPSPNPAPPEAAPESNSSPNPAPQG